MPKFIGRLRATFLLWMSALLFIFFIIGHAQGWVPPDRFAAFSTPEAEIILFSLIVCLLVLHLINEERLGPACFVVAGVLIGMGLFAGVAVGVVWPPAVPLLKEGNARFKSHNNLLQATAPKRRGA